MGRGKRKSKAAAVAAPTAPFPGRYYPALPRRIEARVSERARGWVEEACRRYQNQKGSMRSYNNITYREVFLAAFPPEASYGAISRKGWWGAELEQWELNLGRHKRPANKGLVGDSEDKALLKETADIAHEALEHWASLFEAARQEGSLPPDLDYLWNLVHYSVDPDLVLRLNAGPLPEGEEISPGVEKKAKRPVEARPLIRAKIDPEFSERIQYACSEQLKMPVRDGRSVAECLYLPIEDICRHIQAPTEYVMKRLRWLVGSNTKRPRLDAGSDPDMMALADTRAEQILAHWLALHEVLGNEGTSAQLLKTPLLLTDVQRFSNLDRYEEHLEHERLVQEIGERGRRSLLAE